MKKTAFTLVELIVTITILAILGTIAFINLRMYISESKNSKVLNDLNSIATSLKSESVSGKNIIAFLSDSTSSIPNITLSGKIGILWINEYGAGDINFQAFKVQADTFKNPYSGAPYKLGITTIFPDSTFQVVGTVTRSDSWLKANKILGTYVPRKNTRLVSVNSINYSDNSIKIFPEDIGYFYVWDLIESAWVNYTVTSISSNNSNLKLDTLTWLTSSSLLTLKYSESIGLVWSKNDLDLPVIDWWSDFPY